MHSVLSNSVVSTDEFGFPTIKLASSAVPSSTVSGPLHERRATAPRATHIAPVVVDEEPTSRAYAASLNNIGTMHHEKGDFERAIVFYREALVERMDAPRPAGTAETARRLNETRTKLQQARREERIQRVRRSSNVASSADGASCEVLDIFEDGSDIKQRMKSLPTLQPLLIEDSNADLMHHELGCSAVSLYNLALVYSVEGENMNHDVALDLLETALSALRKCEGSSDSKTRLLSLVHNGAGRIFFLKGKQTEAAQQFALAANIDRRALDAAERALEQPDASTDHTEISALKVRFAASQSNLGRVHFATGDFDRAMYHVKDALRLRIDSRGVNHIDVAATLCSIGVVYREMGELDEALDHCRWFVHIARDVLGLDHPQLRRAIVLTHGIRKEIGLLKHVTRAAAAA